MCDNLEIEARSQCGKGLQSPVSVPSGRYSVQSRQWGRVAGQIMLPGGTVANSTLERLRRGSLAGRLRLALNFGLSMPANPEALMRH